MNKRLSEEDGLAFYEGEVKAHINRVNELTSLRETLNDISEEMWDHDSTTYIVNSHEVRGILQSARTLIDRAIVIDADCMSCTISDEDDGRLTDEEKDRLIKEVGTEC